MIFTPNEILTLAIASYGAIISTFVLGWDAYKYLAAGAKINLSATTNMKVVSGFEEGNETYISAIAQNVGDRPTTITNLGGMYYSSWWKVYLWRRKPDVAFIVTQPSDSQPIPYRFEVGCQWIGMVLQTEDLRTKAQDGYLFFILYTACNGRGTRVRVKAKKNKNKSN